MRAGSFAVRHGRWVAFRRPAGPRDLAATNDTIILCKEIFMSSKTLFLTAALAGAFAGSLVVSSPARACGDDKTSGASADKMGCSGKDKASCKGKDKTDKSKDKGGGDKAEKPGGDKASCSGKHGCGSKAE
jgi:hypothetical protein